MLQINIRTQPINLEYNLQNAQLNLKSIPPKLLMETIPPKLEIRQPQGQLTIDQTPCRYSIGLKNNTDFAHDNVQLGRQALLEGIARRAAEGNRLAQIQNKTNAIADIATDSTRKSTPSLTWAHIKSPIITYQASPVEFNVIKGRVNYNLQRGTIQKDYQPGKVDIEVKQYSSIEFSIVDLEV